MMFKLKHQNANSELPFLLKQSKIAQSKFRILRFWRSLKRPQRLSLVALALFTAVFLTYAWQLRIYGYHHQTDQNNHEFQAAAHKSVAEPNSNFAQYKDDSSKVEDAQKPKYAVFRGPQNDRQALVVKAFKHAWNNYKAYAWGHDHLLPLSQRHSEWFNMGLTIVDSLDTLLIMGLKDEFEEARVWVEKSLTFNSNKFVSFFEATIRVLGGLLSAFHLSGDTIFKNKAEEVGSRLIYAYGSKYPIPYSDVNLFTRTGKQLPWNPDCSLSEITTVQLEFRDLSRITKNSTYEDLSFQTSKYIHEIGCDDHDGLCAMFISPKTGKFRESTTLTLGARSDSYYEYLLKQWVQTGKTVTWLKDDYNKCVNGMEKLLLHYSLPNKLAYYGEMFVPGNTYSSKMDHLACFIAGTLTLGALNGLPAAHLERAREVGLTCHEMYKNPTGLGPEIAFFNDESTATTDDIFIKPRDAHCLLRPEAIEAWFYLYRATGDKIYQEWGWEAFLAIEKYAKVSHGYASVKNVKRIPVIHNDSMESFFLAETLKYLYLLLADKQDEIPLDKYVFNSEGHPLPIYEY